MEATKDTGSRELQKLLIAEGLLEQKTGFYILYNLAVLGLFGISAVLIYQSETFWQRMAIAVFYAYAKTHGGLSMHCIAHDQVSLSPRWCQFIYGCFDFLLCWNTMWWAEAKHGVHHLDPNNLYADPDVRGDFVSFSIEQAQRKKGFSRFGTRWQHLFLWPLLTFVAWHMQFASARYLVRQKTVAAAIGLSLMALHAVVYLGSLFLLGWPVADAVAFVFVHNAFLGLHLGLVFVTNHIGRPMDVEGSYFERQVVTARDVRNKSRFWCWVNTYLVFGGLNFQIVHHIFPDMSLPNLRRASEIVEEYCKKRGIDYHSVSPWQAYKEVYVFFRNVGRSVA